MVANVIVVVFAACLFDHEPEQQKTIIAVFPAAAGFEGQVALAVQRDVVFERAKLQAMRVKLRTKEIARASGVSKQMMDGHLGCHVLVRIIGEIFSQRIIELELALLERKSRV